MIKPQEVLSQFTADIILSDRERLLLNLVEHFLDEIEILKRENQTFKDEINRLKGEKGKPKIKANTKPATDDINNDELQKDKQSKKGKKKNKKAKKKDIPIDTVKRIAIDCDLPGDAVFKGYSKLVIQEIELKRNNLKFELEQYYSASLNKTYIASLPSKYQGSLFGPQLRSFIINLKYQYRMTEPLIFQFLDDIKIDMSQGTLTNILSNNTDIFRQEIDEVVKAGLESPYICTDDTGARHNGSNYYTTVLRSDFFTAFFTSQFKSRLNFINVLCGGKGLQYIFDDYAIAYLNNFFFSKEDRIFIDSLKGKSFANLEEIEDLTEKLPGKQKFARILEAGALSYYLKQDDYNQLELLISDEAKQFVLPCHINALCLVHIDRHFKKLTPKVPLNQSLVDDFRSDFWDLYDKLQAYKENPDEEQKLFLDKEFDELFSRETGYNQLDELISKTKDKKSGILVVLNHPEIPLHNNSSEQEIRHMVLIRKISFGTRSENGRKARDTFIGLLQTCKKHGVSFGEYLNDRMSKLNEIPRLSDLIRKKLSSLFDYG